MQVLEVASVRSKEGPVPPISQYMMPIFFLALVNVFYRQGIKDNGCNSRFNFMRVGKPIIILITI